MYSTWNTPNKRDDSDHMASLRHSRVFHGTTDKPPIYEFYSVAFVEQPSLTIRTRVKINSWTT